MAFVDQIGALRENEAGPRYMRLQKLIRHAVDSRRLAAGAALPSERDLCEEYGLSRVTIRKAIDGLVEEGLLERRQGAGTFVSENLQKASSGRVEKSFSKLSSFSEDMLARGRKPSSEWLSRSAGLVTPEESLSLGLSPGRQVYRFQRLRFADDVPMAFETSTIAADCLAGIDAVKDSLYAALEAEGNRPVRALQRLRAMPFPGEQARRLGVETGHAGLLIERRGFLGDGRAVEYTQSYYRGDAYDVVAELNAG